MKPPSSYLIFVPLLVTVNCAIKSSNDLSNKSLEEISSPLSVSNCHEYLDEKWEENEELGYSEDEDEFGYFEDEEESGDFDDDKLSGDFEDDEVLGKNLDRKYKVRTLTTANTADTDNTSSNIIENPPKMLVDAIFEEWEEGKRLSDRFREINDAKIGTRSVSNGTTSNLITENIPTVLPTVLETNSSSPSTSQVNTSESADMEFRAVLIALQQILLYLAAVIFIAIIIYAGYYIFLLRKIFAEDLESK